MSNGKPINYLKAGKPFIGRNKCKRKARLRARSKKNREQDKVYGKLRREFLASHPKCQVCNEKQSQEVHHQCGRRSNYLRVDTFLAVCRDCHHQIHTNVKWAEEMGYLSKARNKG